MIERLQLEVGKRLINVGFNAFKFSPLYERRGVRVELDPEAFRVLPGLLHVESFEPEGSMPSHMRWRQMPSAPSLFGDAAISPVKYVQTHVLELKQYAMQVEVDVTEPVARRHDYSMRWKAHPPSKRRHMKSWRYAPDSVKRQYAPCKGKRWLPHWAWHPDAGRRNRLGLAVVSQRLYVYAQPSVDIEELMQERSREWLRKVGDALSM